MVDEFILAPKYFGMCILLSLLRFPGQLVTCQTFLARRHSGEQEHCTMHNSVKMLGLHRDLRVFDFEARATLLPNYSID